jgi:hypothetical protein
VASTDREVLLRPFGAESRRDLLDTYFSATPTLDPLDAWKHIYRLLLWIDRTTGLAHCYESDKAQPGRPWYARSLAFHDWLSAALGTAPDELGGEIDWLFTQGAMRLATATARLQDRRAELAAAQRNPYQGRSFPVPGEDPELAAILLEELGQWLTTDPPHDALVRLARRIRAYIGQENRRKNLVGEGFEDVLAAVIQRLPRASDLVVQTRAPLHALPGFRAPPGREKARTVDLAIVKADGRRILATVKWSIRADREEQFEVDFAAYARLEDAGEDFDFVLVTNEFDAARLVAACDRRRQAGPLFTDVIHVNPSAPLAAYGSERRRGAAARLDGLVASGRLGSLSGWLTAFTH